MVRSVLIAHTIIIGLIGLAFIFNPTILAEGSEVQNIMTQSFGVACVATTVLSSLMLTMEGHKHVKQLGAATLTSFHFGLFVVHLLGWIENISPVAFPVIHLVFLLLFIVLVVKYYK
jgi:hypothetical protein